jgi:hypothetical protein
MHFRLIANDGPPESAYREINPLGDPFPTEIIWYTDATKAVKILKKTLTRNGIQQVTQVVWEVYAADGITVEQTVTDVITYMNNIFEDTRTRTVT